MHNPFVHLISILQIHVQHNLCTVSNILCVTHSVMNLATPRTLFNNIYTTVLVHCTLSATFLTPLLSLSGLWCNKTFAQHVLLDIALDGGIYLLCSVLRRKTGFLVYHRKL